MHLKVSDGVVLLPVLLAALGLCNLRLWPRARCHGLEAPFLRVMTWPGLRQQILAECFPKDGLKKAEFHQGSMLLQQMFNN